MKAKIYTPKEIAEYQRTTTMHKKVRLAQEKEAKLPTRRRFLTPKQEKELKS